MSKIALSAIPEFKKEIVKLQYEGTHYSLGGANDTDVMLGNVNISLLERESKETTNAVNFKDSNENEAANKEIDIQNSKMKKGSKHKAKVSFKAAPNDFWSKRIGELDHLKIYQDFKTARQSAKATAMSALNAKCSFGKFRKTEQKTAAQYNGCSTPNEVHSALLSIIF
jgi:hypothetical protein